MTPNSSLFFLSFCFSLHLVFQTPPPSLTQPPRYSSLSLTHTHKDYTFDSIQAIIWGLSSGAGLKSVIVYWYPIFHATMLLHRNGRDDARCARKYKQDWKEYQKLVPYS